MPTPALNAALLVVFGAAAVALSLAARRTPEPRRQRLQLLAGLASLAVLILLLSPYILR